jgi:hypothetical protein
MQFCLTCLGKLSGRLRTDLRQPCATERFERAVEEAKMRLKILKSSD